MDQDGESPTRRNGKHRLRRGVRWCVDRLASVAPGSPLHGVSLLNLAAWHLNEGEQMMSLVTLSDISSDERHPSEIIGLSRLESGRILASIGDFEPAMRHLWIAMRRLSSSRNALRISSMRYGMVGYCIG